LLERWLSYGKAGIEIKKRFLKRWTNILNIIDVFYYTDVLVFLCAAVYLNL
jgi:hypothetical protein